MKSFVPYLKNVRAELKHVVWPNSRVAAGHVVLIIIISALVAAIISVFDLGFTSGVEKVIGL